MGFFFKITVLFNNQNYSSVRKKPYFADIKKDVKWQEWSFKLESVLLYTHITQPTYFMGSKSCKKYGWLMWSCNRSLQLCWCQLPEPNSYRMSVHNLKWCCFTEQGVTVHIIPCKGPKPTHSYQIWGRVQVQTLNNSISNYFCTLCFIYI